MRKNGVGMKENMKKEISITNIGGVLDDLFS